MRTILSQNTSDTNRDVAYGRLRERFPTWEEVRDAALGDVEEAIRPGGLSAIKAPRIQEALRLIEDVPPRLLILDIQMPRVDGPALARELRARLRDLPVIVMTARPHPEREADRCNAVASLGKPFDTRDLVRVVRRFAH